MSSQSYFYLSKLPSAYSPKDEYKIALPYRLPPSLPPPPYIYLYQHYTYVPYKVAIWRVVQKNLSLTLTHPHLLAKERSAHDLFLAWPWLKRQLQKYPSLDNLVFCTNFVVLNPHGKPLGTIAGIQERTIQPLLIIDKDSKEISVPVHQKFIRDIDFHQRLVHLKENY